MEICLDTPIHRRSVLDLLTKAKVGHKQQKKVTKPTHTYRRTTTGLKRLGALDEQT